MSGFLSLDDRFIKLRLGRIEEDVNEKGQIPVKWLDGEVGGQDPVMMTYSCINVVDSPYWGIECGYGKGTIGVFGFLADNHAVLLTTVTSMRLEDGFNLTGAVKAGEYRIKSKAGASVHLDTEGGITVQGKQGARVFIDQDGNIEITGNTITVADTMGEARIEVSGGGINLESGSIPITIGGKYNVLYSLVPDVTKIVDVAQIGVSRGVRVKK